MSHIPNKSTSKNHKKNPTVEEKLQSIANNVSIFIDDQTSLNERYHRNLLAFKEHFPDIHDFFSHYEAEKVKVSINENFANIINIETKEFMYEYPAYLMALAQVQEYKKSPLSSTSKFFTHDEKLGDFLHSQKLNPIVELLQARVDSDVDKTHELPKHLNALVIFGIGLGYHLDLLNQQHTVGSVYLIEPCLDTFYASLFTANWEYTLNSMNEKGVNLFISLGPQEDDFFDKLLKETYLNGRYEVAKTHLFIHQNSAEITQLVGQYKSRFFEMIQGWGFFDDGIMAMSHFLKSLKLGVPLLKKNVPFDIDVATTPVFIIGNGPSLDDHIEFIKKHQDCAIIISCASALSALYKCGIEIDIHCEQERIFAVAEKIEYYAPAHYIKQQTLMSPSTVHPAVYEKFKRVIMAPKASEPSTSLLLQNPATKGMFEEATNITPTVANTALVMASKLGFRQFYFLGVDLGRKKEGAHHSQHSFYYDGEGKDIDLYPQMDNEFVNPGNFTGEYLSDPIFNMSKIALERFIKENSHIACFNASDGVKINGSEPILLSELVAKFEHAASINKEDLVDRAYQLASYEDDGSLYQELVDSADLDGFEELCQWLIDDISENIDSIESAIRKVRAQSHIVREVELSGKRHLSLLINGSILHMQAMLTRLLYEAKSETIALSDFQQALVHYLEFLSEAPNVYRSYYKEPIDRETNHLEALRKVQS